MKALIKKIFTLTQVFLFGLVFILPTPTALARDQSCYKTFLGLNPWYQYLEVTKEDGTCNIIYEDISDTIYKVAIAIVDMLVRVAGIVAFAFLITSGFRLVLAQGDPAKEKAARGAALNAVIGMVIALFATSTIAFLTRSLIS